MTTDKVVDASALAAATFEEPRAAEAMAQLATANLHAPPLIRFEMAHVCVKKIRDRPSDRAAILGQFAASMHVPLHLVEVDHEDVVVLAERLNLSAYDASYLWLARNLGIELVTLDARLEKAAARL